MHDVLVKVCGHPVMSTPIQNILQVSIRKIKMATILGVSLENDNQIPSHKVKSNQRIAPYGDNLVIFFPYWYFLGITIVEAHS